MKLKSSKESFARARENVNRAYCFAIVAALTLTGSPAFAQLDKVTSTANTLVTFAAGAIAIAVITLAFLYVGFKVLFRGQALADLWHVVAGAVLIGGASGFAAFAMSS